jgi:hypothetical protein
MVLLTIGAILELGLGTEESLHARSLMVSPEWELAMELGQFEQGPWSCFHWFRLG